MEEMSCEEDEATLVDAAEADVDVDVVDAGGNGKVEVNDDDSDDEVGSSVFVRDVADDGRRHSLLAPNSPA